MVETAMLFLFLCGLFVVVLDFGQVLHRYLVVSHARSAAARVAAVENSTLADIQTAAQNAAADSLPTTAVVVTCKATSFTLSGGTPTGAYSSGGANCSTSGKALAVDTRFVVTVTATYTPLLPFIGFVFGTYHNGAVSISHTAVGLVQRGAA